MPKALRDPHIVADYFTQGYRVSGALTEKSRSLSDIIYDRNTSYLLIQAAYLSPITDPAKITGYFESTTVAKINLDFVLTIDQKDGLRLDQQYTLGTLGFNVSLIVPFFEIRGRLPTPGRTLDPRVFLTNQAGVFVTLLDVTARCTFSPDVSYQGGVALINTAKISFMGEREAALDRRRSL